MSPALKDEKFVPLTIEESKFDRLFGMDLVRKHFKNTEDTIPSLDLTKVRIEEVDEPVPTFDAADLMTESLEEETVKEPGEKTVASLPPSASRKGE